MGVLYETTSDTASDRDALRLQIAAVAAQQVALGEEEVRLLHRKTALKLQEEQLSSHLEEKRRKILALHERARAERKALHQNRVAYEKHVAKITDNLTGAQREVLVNQESLWAERRRLAELYRRLRRRLYRQQEVERDYVKRREEDLARITQQQEQEGQRLRNWEDEIQSRLAQLERLTDLRQHVVAWRARLKHVREELARIDHHLLKERQNPRAAADASLALAATELQPVRHAA
jgi:chromosome segregation ATPase